jgi:hypothetical protein
VRAFLVVLALAALTAGCSSSTSSEGSAPKAGTLAALWKASKQSVALIPGTNDYAPGTIRVSFLVVDSRAKLIATPTARVWLARSLDSPPFQQTVARLEDVGVPGVSTGADSPTIYVAHLRVPTAGKYVVLARPIGGSVSIGGIRDLLVRSHSVSPAVGTRAYPSQTPTIASTGGNFRKLTTRVPPDRALLRYSIADSLRKQIPFVVTFATPRYCSSRVCGPVVDVVDGVRRQMGAGIRFIHVEIYKNNDPRQGRNEWVKQWKLPSEPWTFLVGRDGLIKAKFEGSVSTAELGSTIRRNLR